MRSAHTVEQVRAAEAELMGRLPEGALMQRAAAGLAHAVLDLLGTAYGRRVLLLVGSGDNGGDALYAGVLLSRRGVRVEAWRRFRDVGAKDLPRLRQIAELSYKEGKATILHTDERKHFFAVASMANGTIFAGGSPGGA